MENKIGTEYNGGAITVLKGLEAVRKRPGMYIGGTGAPGLHHLLWEILDNAVDEIANGYGTRAEVILHKDGSVSVEDNGRGIPVDIHPELGVSAVEVVFTELHAGGKFNNSNYQFSGGLHGVGASVVNALSTWLEVEVYHNGYVYYQRFHSYQDANEEWHSGIPLGPLVKKGKTDKRGSYVHFLPDKNVFDSIILNADKIIRHLQDAAFMNKGAHFVFVDERIRESYDEEEQQTPTVQDFCYEGGIIDLVKYINESKTKLFDDVIYLQDKERQDMQLEVAMQYTDDYSEAISSYVNNVPTGDGGTHETGFKKALTRVLNDVAKTRGTLKDKDASFTGEDFREGISCVISLKMKEAQFEGQTKGKLGSSEATSYVEGVVYDKLSAFFGEKGNQKIVDTIMNKALKAKNAREASRKAKETARKASNASNASLIGKLSPATGKKPELNEVFIVEGDSAGGTAKQCRHRATQAILPLRGKIINAEKQRLDKLLSNEEICTIIGALGAGVGDEFDVSKIKYHKVIILADADQDGGHIRSLLITFFYRYMRDLITEGHVYCGMPPLYRLSKKDVVKYVYSDKELDDAIKEMGRGYTLQRYKGLGEMSKDQLWETTMDPDKRTLMRVSIEDAGAAEKMLTVLMGDNIEARKAYISQHADFNRVDTFVKKD